MKNFVLACLTALTVAGCAQNPVTGSTDFVMMSEQDEINLGRQADLQVRKQYKIYPDKALQAYVNEVGQKLAQKSHRNNLTFRFAVLDSTEINAFSLPGGYVYITRGILAYLNSEAEMAAVLGHEIGHVTARHGVRQQSAAQAANIGLTVASIFVPQVASIAGQNISNIVGTAILSGYGRDHELESDRLGAEYLARSGYDPQAMIRVVGVLKDQELYDIERAKIEGREPKRYHGVFASHPDADTRLKQVVGEAGKYAVAAPRDGRDEYLKQIAGMDFGDNAEEGIVRNNQFLHSDLKIAIQYPADWIVHNMPDKLVALSPGGDASILLKMDPKPSGTPADYARRQAGFMSNDSVESLEINKLPGAIATYEQGMLGVIYLNKRAYLLQATAKSRDVFNARRKAIRESILSFHALTDEERKQAQPLHVRIMTAHEGETYAKLAQHSPLGKQAPSLLRLMNAQYPNGEPQAGQKLKIIE